MRFGDAHEIEFIFLPLRGSAPFVLPRPHFAADNIFQVGHWHADAKNFALHYVLEKILIARIGCELDVEFAAGASRIHRMLKSRDLKSGGFEIALNLLESCCNHHKIDIFFRAG